MINDPAVQDPTRVFGKLFRRRFRVPFPLFREFVDMTISLGFEESPANVNGVPIELHVLGVLRVLGRGTCFDDIEESAERHSVFFHQLCR